MNLHKREKPKPRGFDAAKANAFNLVQDYKKAAAEGQKLVVRIGNGLVEICDGRPGYAR
jgi:hypothetical protein